MGGGADGPFISTDANDVSTSAALVFSGVSSSNSSAFGSMVAMVVVVATYSVDGLWDEARMMYGVGLCVCG